MAVIDLVGLVEHWVPGDQVVAGDSGSNRTHAAERTRRELRVVKRVVERGPELDHFGLSNRKPLAHADIEVVEASQRQRVPPTVRVNAGTGLNVASVRIVGQVSDHVPIAVDQRRYVASGAVGTVRIDHDPVRGTVQVAVGVQPALHRGILRRLRCVHAGKHPVSQYVLAQPPSRVPIPRSLVDPSDCEAVRAVEERTPAFGAHVLEVLGAPRRQQRREEVGRAVVDVLAPGVGADELEAVREPPFRLSCEPVVDRVAAVGKREDKRAESGIRELRKGCRLRVDVTESQCQRVQFGVSRTLVERGKGTLRIRPGRQRQDCLREELDSAGAKVARGECVVLLDDSLDPEIPLERVRQVLVRDVGRSERASPLLIKLVRPLVGANTAVREIVRRIDRWVAPECVL